MDKCKNLYFLESEKHRHPLLPDGEWEGFYLYRDNSHKHMMSLMMRFGAGTLEGTGFDDIGPFSLSGTFDMHTMTCTWFKSYRTHQIFYSGHIDENGIWGQWRSHQSEMSFSLKGGFHIWPIKQHQEEEAKLAKEVMSGSF